MLLLSHNAYWFQGCPSLWGEEQIRAHPEVLAALAGLYRQHDPDVVCLQEVPSEAVAHGLAATLGMDVAYAAGGIRTGYGGAVLWRDDGASVSDLTRTGTGRGEVFERIAMRLEYQVGTRRLSILNLHLASNRFAPAGNGEPVRLAEVEAALGNGALPDVVTGDFNAVTASAVYAEMVFRGYRDARAEATRHGRPAARRIDYVWVRADAGLKVVEHGVVDGESFRLPGVPDCDLSDHHPIWARLRSIAEPT